MTPDPEAFPVLELSPAELVAEHTGREVVERFLTGRQRTRWVDGRWVSLSRARLGPEEES